MSEQQREHVSALADGELAHHLTGPTIAALEANPELRASWERYHLIGAVLHREAGRFEYRAIADRVRVQLQTEPVPISRARPTRGQPASAAQPRLRSRASHYAGIGLAAGAAFIAVFALPPLLNPDQPAPTGPSLAQVTPVPSGPSASSAPPAVAAGPAVTVAAPSALRTADGPPGLAVRTPYRPQGSGGRWQQAEPQIETKLNRFLVNHQASSPAGGIKGLFPYATVVGYEADR